MSKCILLETNFQKSPSAEATPSVPYPSILVTSSCLIWPNCGISFGLWRNQIFKNRLWYHFRWRHFSYLTKNVTKI